MCVVDVTLKIIFLIICLRSHAEKIWNLNGTRKFIILRFDNRFLVLFWMVIIVKGKLIESMRQLRFSSTTHFYFTTNFGFNFAKYYHIPKLLRHCGSITLWHRASNCLWKFSKRLQFMVYLNGFIFSFIMLPYYANFPML